MLPPYARALLPFLAGGVIAACSKARPPAPETGDAGRTAADAAAPVDAGSPDAAAPRSADAAPRRGDAGWKLVAPRGKEQQHYLAPEPYRGGALGIVLDIHEYDDSKASVLGFDLPGGWRGA